MKHTPGPWSWWPKLCGDPGGIITADSTGNHVAKPTYYVINQDVTEANARLIAAAPELLEALVRMVEVFDPYASPGGWCESEGEFVNVLLVKRVEGLIAKQKGVN